MATIDDFVPLADESQELLLKFDSDRQTQNAFGFERMRLIEITWGKNWTQEELDQRISGLRDLIRRMREALEETLSE